jgi:hypothetical protein
MSRAREAGPAVEEGQERVEELELPDLGLQQQNPASPLVSRWPVNKQEGAHLPATAIPLTPQAVGVDFEGVSYKEYHLAPPDCDGAAGPTQFLLFVNGTIRTFTKSGIPDGALSARADTFFSAVRGGELSSDPHVIFDRLTQRWFIVMGGYNSGGATANRIMIAVSSGSTITSASNFTFFEFRHDSVGGFPNPDSGALADYPTFGLDANALYIGVNIFGPPNAPVYKGSTAFVIRKSSVLSGGPIVVTPFRHTATSTGVGAYSPQGVTNDDPGATEGYFIGSDGQTLGLLQVRRISDPGGTPTMSGNLSITVPATAKPANVPHKGGTGLLLSGFDDRLSQAIMKSGRVWTSHQISVSSSGVAFTGSGARDGVRFYEITNLSGTPTLNQSGTLYDSLATAPRYFWVPGIAMTGQGHVAIGCSYAGLGDYAGVAYAGRLSGDPLGTVRTPTLFASNSAYNLSCPFCASQRWGDYSITSVDPNDDMTIWTVQEYCDTTNSWGVRVTQLKAPPPAIPSGASPDSVLRGASHVIVSITGTTTNGSGFYDPGSGFPRRISASVDGGGVTVNSITFTDSTHMSMDISVDSGAALTSRTITVMNPDSQSATSAAGILKITGPTSIDVAISIQARWNIVSNPVGAANDSTRNLFPGASSPAFAYTSGSGYQIAPRIVNGIGAWMRFVSPETTTIQGSTLAADSIPVSDGWNLIGSISAPIQASSITSNPPGIVTSKFFGYTGSYQTTDTIHPGEGYWVKVNQAGALYLSSAGAASPGNRIRIVPSAELPPAPPEPANAVPAPPLPKEYALEQNYPNPFNPTTVIRYQLPAQSRVSLRVYDVLGEEVKTLIDGVEEGGYRSFTWDASAMASGVYFYRLTASTSGDARGSYEQVRKLILEK